MRQVGRRRRTDFLEVGECEVEIAVEVFVARGRDNEAFDATVGLQPQSQYDGLAAPEQGLVFGKERDQVVVELGIEDGLIPFAGE